MTTGEGLAVPEQTVGALLDDCAADAPSGQVIFPDDRADWSGLAGQTDRLARALLAAGVRCGDHVGVLLHGQLDSVRCWLAAAKIGAVTVPLNVRFKAAELRYVLNDADLAMLLTSTEFLPEVRVALPEPAPTVVALDSGDGPPGCLGRVALEAGADRVGVGELAAARRAVRAGDPTIMLYTSGTTAAPRGCRHDHNSLVAEGAAVAERIGLRADDRFWTPLPMFHCGGYDVALAAMAGRCGMVHVGSFEPGLALRQLAEQRCTVAFPAFETIWLPVLEHPDFARTDLSALRLVINVGSVERMRMMQARLPGAVQVSCMGMTESFGFCCVGSPHDPAEVRASTAGMPLRHMQARVVDPATGGEMPAGTPGEFQFRGSSRMIGYHRDAEPTGARIDADGWFSSGDLVVADPAGRLRFVSRIKDMLKVGGENVAAADVEGYLSQHPAVGVVQVVGAPDRRYGEVVAAFVQLRPGARATEAELIEFCLGQIATFKVPRYVRFIDDPPGWPMSGTKIQKFRLRERIVTELTSAGVTEAPHPGRRTNATPTRRGLSNDW
jgi:fatty-acyl-CoA synthase